MKLATIDLAILAGYFALTLAFGLFFARKAKESMLDYLMTGRAVALFARPSRFL